MCGISGFYVKNRSPLSNSEQLLKKNNQNLSHRGPDGSGSTDFKHTGLTHNRLSILDLSDAAKQPMQFNNIHITYNGEIYNFPNLKLELQALGYSFQTNSDTEVLLKAYHKWGVNAFGKLNGMFAVGIYNSVTDELLLARDPVGIKPLFYFEDQEHIFFASEVRTLLQNNRIPIDYDLPAIDAYFTYYYTPAPHTGISGLSQVEPGSCLIFKGKQKTDIVFYKWSFTDTDFKQTPYDKKEFQRQLLASVERQLVSDVPVGAFLSGGADSTAIALALKLLGKSDVKFYHFAFDDEKYSELPFAKHVAKKLDVKLEVIRGEANFDTLPIELSPYLMEPTADPSSLAMFLLCQGSKKHSKVFLSGDGSDEILAGYKTYSATFLAENFKSPVMRGLSSFLNPATSLIPVKEERYSKFQILDRWLKYSGKPYPFDHCNWRTIFSEKFKTEIYSDSFYQSTKNADPINMYARHLTDVKHLPKLEQMLYMDLKHYLPNDMLVKADRMGMRSGLEIRVPFLDLEFINYSYKIPSQYKLNGKETKHALKEFLYQSFEPSFVNRPKAGFNIPLSKYLRTSWYSVLMDCLNMYSAECEAFLNIKMIKKMCEDHRAQKKDFHHELFTILMFLLWVKNIKDMKRGN